MDELGPDEQKWLDVLRAADEPRAADRARVRSAVLEGIAGAGVASATAAGVAGIAKAGTVAAVTKTASATGLVAGTWKIGLAVVSLVVAGGVTAAVVGRTPRTSETARSIASASAAAANATAIVTPPPTSTPEPAFSAPSVTAETAANEATEPTKPTASAAAPATATNAAPRTTAQAKPGDDVDAEVLLITQAQRTLERGDPNAALGVLARHGREHPRGAFAVEREGLRAIASCEAKRADGRALAERFVAAHPRSPLVSRVRATCLSP